MNKQPYVFDRLRSYSGNPNYINPNQLVNQPRQDLIINGVKPMYDCDLFENICVYAKNQSTKDYNFKHSYSTNSYLDTLIIRAHSLNDGFQKQMSKLFDSYKNINVVYNEAPVKLRERCVIKANTDYANEEFPNTACICDLIRCSFTFRRMDDLLLALDVFESRFSQQIVRIKNGFSSYISGMPLEYRDIKYNLIIFPDVLYGLNAERGALIGEVQFILEFMTHAKAIGHSLYSIVRKHDYVHNVSKIYEMQFGSNKDCNSSEYYNNIHNYHHVLNYAITKRNTSRFGLVLSKNIKDALFNARDDSNDYSTMGRLLFEYWYKGYKLLHSFFIKYLKDNNIIKQRNELFSKLINHDRISKREAPIMSLGFATKESFSKIVEINLLFKEIVNKYGHVIEFNYLTPWNEGVLHALCHRDHWECLEILFKLSCNKNIKNKIDIDINAGKHFMYLIFAGKSLKSLKVLLDPKYKRINNNVKFDKDVMNFLYNQKPEMDEYIQVIEQFLQDKDKN